LSFPETPEFQDHREPLWPTHLDQRAGTLREAVRANRLWLHILLFVVTLLSTSAVGARFSYNFDHNLPAFEPARDMDAFWSWWREPEILAQGLPFSLTLLTILMAHESGHYVACLFYRIDASLPYFLPAPTFTGTMGAFIRIRSPIFSRRQLFDIGIAGPIAGFIFLLPAAGVGLALSKVIPGIADTGSLRFGTPLLLRGLEWLVFPGHGASDIYLHPVARAAWVGMFATALNLLPAGQLDGGHIVYALFEKRHKWVTWAVIIALVVLGIFWYGWLLWAILLFFFARRHPQIYDVSGIGRERWWLGLLGFILLLLCFTIAPVNQTG
jgi:membrane-associated protease RseP (regulator of RpoE activity)